MAAIRKLGGNREIPIRWKDFKNPVLRNDKERE